MKNRLPLGLKKKTTLFCLILITHSVLVAQNRNNEVRDSLRSVWTNIKKPDSVRFKAINSFYVKNTFAQPDSVLLLTNYHFDLAVAKKNDYEKAMAYNEKSYAYYIKGDTKTSMKMLESSIAILEKLDNPMRLATVYSNLGNIYGEEDKYQEAVRYFTKSLKIFEEENVLRGEARMLNNLGIVYFYLDNDNLTLDYLNRALKKYKAIGLEKNNGATLTVIGEVYFKQGKYQEALAKAEKALTLLLDQNNLFAATSSYLLLAKTHHKLGNAKKAHEFIDKGIEICYQLDNNSRIIESLTFKAELSLETNTNEATKQAEHLLTLLTDDTENDLKASLYLLLYKCYKAQKKYDKSLQMHEIHLSFNDSVQLEKNNMVIIEEAIKNEFEEKLLSEKLANKNIQTELRIRQVKKTYFLIAIFITVIMAILFYTRAKTLAHKKKRALLLKELEQLKKVETTTASNTFQLDREKIETTLHRTINETDWAVLNILLEDPVISNKEIAQKAFMSIDGIGSSLRRMYDYFEIKESKYKKISLLLEATKMSNKLT